MFADAEAYERFMGRWSRLVAPSLVEFGAVPDSGRILDVGSGTGSLAFSIARRTAHTRITGIDPARSYVDYSQSINPFPDRVGFQTGDAQDLKFPDAVFDCALSLLVFNFIPDAKKALGEIRRATKPGGIISAATWDYGDGMRMLRIFWDAAGAVNPSAGERDEKRMPLCREDELRRLWTAGGLTDVRTKPIEIKMSFQNFGDYWDPFLLGQGPAGAYIQETGPDQRSAVRSEVMRRLALSSDDEPFDLPARAWAVRGMVPPGG